MKISVMNHMLSDVIGADSRVFLMTLAALAGIITATHASMQMWIPVTAIFCIAIGAYASTTVPSVSLLMRVSAAAVMAVIFAVVVAIVMFITIATEATVPATKYMAICGGAMIGAFLFCATAIARRREKTESEVEIEADEKV